MLRMLRDVKSVSAATSHFCVKGVIIEPYLKNWAEQIKQDAEESRRLKSLDREADALKQLARAKPLDVQITELMQSLPPAMRDRPWNMAELTSRLQGKYRDRPHPQQVGEALRKLGWYRVRLYGEYDGARLWLPANLNVGRYI